MANVFEALINTLRTLIDNEPKSPLHTGEVTSCWLYFTAMSEALHYEQQALNTTTDDDLLEMLADGVKTCGSQVKRLEEFMKQEGIPLPSMPADKPRSNPQEIPLGVKMTDDEIANGISAKVAYMNVMCASSQSQAVRTDIGLMFVEFQAELLTFGASVKTLMRRRGWIRVPPYYNPPGLPDR
ncbi:DUF3231 family protein [Bacillus sp. T33-2]|uniref:DUF3231 family protein n=1 Tax=Bacillus sp. T33-2 TaxID=2054168 RepID=UPI000C76780A|nr:DUF3231 family protein [Bacillus sp. T33-2]PLR96871.1 hypothetical protein CVD19_09760 [Bacillus sp. T33-2]